MALKYKCDVGLEFLQYCSSEDLNFLVELYITEAKITEELSSHEEYKKYYPNHIKYWKLIAAELQYFGGNSIVNRMRGHGVKYKEILIDICEKEYISFDRKANISQIEKVFVYFYLKKSIQLMNPNELKVFKSNFNLSNIEEISLMKEIYERFFSDSDRLFYQNIISSLIGSLGKNIFKQGIKTALPIVAEELLKKAVGIPIAVALVLKDITDPAYRITLQAVLYISYLRENYQNKNKMIEKTYLPVIGSILRCDLVGGIIDHSGICIGDNQIVEIYNENNTAIVKIVTYEEFINCSSARTGTSVYIAIDKISKNIISSPQLANIARSQVGKQSKYKLTKDNCHSFVHKCIENKNFHQKVDVFKFKQLTDSISKNLNNGKKVKWVVCDLNPYEYKRKWALRDAVV